MATSAPDFVVVQNFINGEFVDPKDGKYVDIVTPATGKVYGKLPDSSAEDVDNAVKAAKGAFKKWSKTPRADRAKILNKIADLIEANLMAFAEAESRDQGKPVSLAATVDIPRAISNFRFFAGAILHHQESSSEIDNMATNYTYRTPCGVAGLISPWNLPLYLMTWKIAPAIAVGCTCVCKPSEFTSVTLWMLAKIFNEAGLPAGVCNIITGIGPTTGKTLVNHPDVPLISFTGGTATGMHIARDASPMFKKLYLELGGKNPNIIFEDADLDECVATTVRSSFSNQGEICLCGSRILVQESIYDKFVEKFAEATKKLVVGDPKDSKTNVGALISEEHRKRVEYFIDSARKDGGKIIVGGDRPKFGNELDNGFFLNPTIIADLAPSCLVQQEEIFGPVVGITKFKTEEEALEIANGVKYGLAAMVWTTNVKRAVRVAQEIEAGTVWVNCWMVRDLRMPFGGVKASGLGRASGEDSIDFFSQRKTVCLKYT